MLSHLSFGVADLARATAFYDATLAATGCVRVQTFVDAVGYGPPGGDDKLSLKLRPAPIVPPGPGFHLAFVAASRSAVERFHVAAPEHGGRDEGLPGLRPEYGPSYYPAFAVDPDGHKLEAVCQ